MMFQRYVPVRGLAWGLVLAVWAGPLAGQACPEGVISSVVIENNSIFGADKLDGEGRFRWAYGLANTLHMRTRPQFIRHELLFEEGDCHDRLLLEESERLLRDHRFIAQSEVSSVRLPDGTWEVTVATQDEWTTNVNLGISSENGLHVERLDVVEQNLFGRGVVAGGFFFQQDERHDIGARLELPRLFGTRTDGRISLGRTRDGDFLEQSLSFPFVGEVGRFAGREVFSRWTTSFAYSVGAGSDQAPGSITHVLLPLDEQRLEVTMASRFGRPGNLTVFGVGFSNETLEFPEFPDGVEVAVDRDFGSPVRGDSAAVAAVRPQTLHGAGTHINLLVGQRNVRFREFRGLDPLRGAQDVALGSDLALTLGRSVAQVSGGRRQPDDLYARVRLDVAIAPGPVVVRVAGGFEGRQIYSGGAAGGGWKDALGDLAALVYWRPVGWPRHTLAARLAAGGGWSLTQPFQLTLGGASGVRGYDQDDHPGGQRVVLNAEDRIYFAWPYPQMFDLGMTVFGDLGRAWRGEVPFGRDSGWRGSLGAGLRVGFPAESRRVVRLDLAWAVESGGFGAPIFRISLGDPIGLSAGVEDRQMIRSQRLAVGADFFTARSR